MPESLPQKPPKSPKNVKTGKIVQEDTIRFVDENLYRKWMPDEIRRGDILVTSEAPFGQIFLWDTDEKIVLSQRLFGIRPNPVICNPGYLYYWMIGHQFQEEMRGRATGTTVIGLRQPELLKCSVQLPSLDKQAAISACLRTIDEKIDINARLNDYLAEMLDARYGRLIAESNESALLVDIVRILSGGTPKTKNSEYWEDGRIPFFAPGDVTNSVYTLVTEKHITELGLDNCNSALYPVDTVFLTARGTVGKVAMAGRPMAMNQSCFAFAGINAPQTVVFQVIKGAVRSLKAKANGATFAAINTRDLKDEEVPVLSTENMAIYDEWAKPLHAMIRSNEEESLRLAELRDALLPKLMSGEIDVSKVDLTPLNNHLA